MLRALARYLDLPDPYPSLGDDDSDGLYRSGSGIPNEPYRSSVGDQSRATLAAPSSRLLAPDPANAPYQNNAGLLEQVTKVSAPQTPTTGSGGAQSAPKLDGSQKTSGAPHETLNVSAEGVPDIGRQALEEGLYREWYNARGGGRLTDANQIGETYLQQFPQGKYSKWVQAAKTQFAPSNWQTASRQGAGAYISTSAIETMRKNGAPDAQILRYIQDEVARQVGLNDADIEYLTQVFGQHPFANIVEPGTNLKSSIDSIIRQGRTNAGLSELYIHPELLTAIQQHRAAHRPLDSMVESASRGASTGGLKEFLLGVAGDPKIQAQVPSVATAAGLLASSPKAVALLAAVDAGALEHSYGVVQALANIREYLTNPNRAAGTLMDFLMGGSLSEHNVGQTVVKSRLAPMPKSELAETLATAASDVAANRGGVATSSTLRQGTRMLLDMLPTMLAGEAGMPGLLAYGFAERAHEGPDAAALNAAMLAGPFFLISKSPLGGAVRDALADAIDGRLGVTSEMAETATKMTPASIADKIRKAAALAEGGLTEAERAQGARTVRALQARLTVANREAISSATREIRNRMLREVPSLTGEAATKAATFLITSEAITAVKEGRLMTRDELLHGALLLAAFEALPVLQEANRMRGELPRVPRNLIASEEDVQAARRGTRLIGTGQELTEDVRPIPSAVAARETRSPENWQQPPTESYGLQTALLSPSRESAQPSAEPQSEGLLEKIRRYSNPETFLEKILRAIVGEEFPTQSQQPIQAHLLPARNLPVSQPEGFLKHLQRLSRPETMLERIQRIANSESPKTQRRALVSSRRSPAAQSKLLPAPMSENAGQTFAAREHGVGSEGGSTISRDAEHGPRETTALVHFRNSGAVRNWRGQIVRIPEGHVMSPRDPPFSETPWVRYGPFDASQRRAFLRGTAGNSGLAPHHRHQIPVLHGGVIDELEGPRSEEENVHTAGTPSRHPGKSIFNRMKGGNALRSRETKEHWRAKGRRLVELVPGQWVDFGP